MKINNKGLQIFISFGLAILITNIIAQNVNRRSEDLTYECRVYRSTRTYDCNYVEKNSGIISMSIFVIILLILDTIDLWKNK